MFVFMLKGYPYYMDLYRSWLASELLLRSLLEEPPYYMHENNI